MTLESSFLDNDLVKVNKSLDSTFFMEQMFADIKIILETNDHSQKMLYDQLGRQDSLKYSLLLGFLFKFGIGTRKDFEQLKKDKTLSGNILVEYCYFYSWGVEKDNRKSLEYFKWSAKAGNSRG